MNWQRGFFRLWAAFSIGWIVFVAILEIGSRPSGKLKPVTDPVVLSQLNEGWGIEDQPSEAFRIFGITFGPPAALLAMGLLVSWIGSGFKKDNAA